MMAAYWRELPSDRKAFVAGTAFLGLALGSFPYLPGALGLIAAFNWS